MKREITPAEHMVVSRMAEKLPESQRTQLLADLKKATAKSLNADGSIIRFEIGGYERAPSIGRHTSVDGEVKDGDGAHLNVILFTDLNGRLYELEIVRFDAGEIVGPNWTTLQLYCVQTRIGKTVEMGADYGHNARLAEEQQLLQSIEKHLKDR